MESRTSCEFVARCWNHSTRGGPFVPVVVVSSPATTPTAITPRPGLSDGAPVVARRCWRAWRTTAPRTARPTASWRTGFVITPRMSAPRMSPGVAAAIRAESSLHRTWRSRRSPKRTRRFSAAPSASSVVSAPARSRTANSTGPRMSANPKPVVDCTVAPRKATRAAITNVTVGSPWSWRRVEHRLRVGRSGALRRARHNDR